MFLPHATWLNIRNPLASAHKEEALPGGECCMNYLSLQPCQAGQGPGLPGSAGTCLFLPRHQGERILTEQRAILLQRCEHHHLFGSHCWLYQVKQHLLWKEYMQLDERQPSNPKAGVFAINPNASFLNWKKKTNTKNKQTKPHLFVWNKPAAIRF